MNFSSTSVISASEDTKESEDLRNFRDADTRLFSALTSPVLASATRALKLSLS